MPFNPVDKYTIAIVKDRNTGATFRIMKGAPQVSPLCMFLLLHVNSKRSMHLAGFNMLQVVLPLADNRGQIEEGVKEKINEFAGRGFRALGLAVSEGASGQPRFVAALLQDSSV